jgi:hypothetical protein
VNISHYQVIITSIGGIIIILGAIFGFTFGIFRQLNATRENTRELKIVAGRLNKLADNSVSVQNQLDRRITVIEDRMSRS